MTRLERLRALIDEFGVDLLHTTAGEDLEPYLKGGTPVEAFCLVTRTNEHSYLWLADTPEHCEQHANQVFLDNIFAEMPVAIVNMDTGARVVPMPTTRIEWTASE